MTGRRGREAAIVGAALALAGAFAFGAWHVVVGGGLHGNPRAAEFGLALSAVSGVGLAILREVGRRVLSTGR